MRGRRLAIVEVWGLRFLGLGFRVREALEIPSTTKAIMRLKSTNTLFSEWRP